MTENANAPRFLLVDDEPMILETLASILRREFAGCTIDLAPDAAAGMARLDASDYDIVVSDYRMPGQDGVSFLRDVRARRPHAVRILLTAYPEQDAALRGINDAHLERFLTKPISVTEFGAAMREAWDAARAEAARASAFARGLNALRTELEEERARTAAAKSPRSVGTPYRGELRGGRTG